MGKEDQDTEAWNQWMEGGLDHKKQSKRMYDFNDGRVTHDATHVPCWRTVENPHSQ